MASIISVQDGGDYSFGDPNAWQGGVVPGPNDIAYIRHQFTLINSGSGIHHWVGELDSIRVDSTSLLDSTGSFYTYLSPGAQKIKIDYSSSDATYLYSCSVDQSYQQWDPGNSGSNVGIIRDNTPVHSKSTTIYLSGSNTAEVNRVFVQDWSEFIVKDQATLYLNSSTTDSYIQVEDAVFKGLGEVTFALTGSTRRNSSLINQAGSNYQNIILSGSYDPRTKTTVSSSTSENVATIPVTDSSGFAAGDFISISTLEDNRIQMTPEGNNTYERYNYSTTGSNYPYEWIEKYIDEDETLEVIGTGSNELYVKKMYGKDGTIISASINNNTRASFQNKYGVVTPSFSGTRTSITVRSDHNSFKAGDKLTVSGSVYTVLVAVDKLLPYKTVDFSQGAGLEDFYVDEFIGSGSSDVYKTNSFMKSGSALQQDKDIIGTNSYYRSFYLKETRLKDARITISGSMIDENGVYDGNRMIGVSFGDEIYQRDRILPFYNRYGFAHENYIGVYGPYLRLGRNSIDSFYADTRNYEEYTGSRTDQSPFELTMDCLRENVDYYNGSDFLAQATSLRIMSDIGIHLRREGALFSKLVVEEYVQELLLDTSDSFVIDNKIYEGGTLVNHSEGQEVLKIASTIKDLRGYTDIGDQYSQGNLEGNVPPIFFSNNGNLTYYRNSDTTHEYGRTDGMLRSHPHNYYFRVLSSGNRYFDLNLGKETTFDAIGITHNYAANNAYLKGFGVEVSNDGHTWTVIRAQADDLRVGAGASYHRLFHVPQTTARFLRIRVNGGSASANNYIPKLSIYNFNGRGNTIELNNTSDINVGDKIQFIFPRGYSNYSYIYSRYSTPISNYISGTKTESDLVGGPYPHYTVTAKTGNIITLDRDVEGEYLTPDALVVRVDRPLKVTTDVRYPFGLYYGGTSNGPRRMEIYNVEALSLGTNSREQNQWYFSTSAGKITIANCSFHYLEPDSSNLYTSNLNWKNNLLSNSSSQILRSYRYASDSSIHGNIIQAYYINMHWGGQFGTWYTGNIMASDRRVQVAGLSAAEQMYRKTIVRNNYFGYKDYFGNANGINYDSVGQFIYDYYSNVRGADAGYNRWNTQPREGFITKNKVELPEMYPSVKNNPFYWNGYSGFHDLRYYGSSAGESVLVLNDPQFGYRSHISNANQRSIVKRKDSNEFDVIADHLNRVNAVVLQSHFNVYSSQQVRVVANIDYYNDIFLRENDWNRQFIPLQMFLLSPDRQTITSRVLPYQNGYNTFVFDETFDAVPGVYSLILNKLEGNGGTRIMTYRDANFLVRGTNPEDIDIIYNGFADHQLLLNTSNSKINNMQNIGQTPLSITDNRDIVSLRKIKF